MGISFFLVACYSISQPFDVTAENDLPVEGSLVQKKVAPFKVANAPWDEANLVHIKSDSVSSHSSVPWLAASTSEHVDETFSNTPSLAFNEPKPFDVSDYHQDALHEDVTRSSEIMESDKQRFKPHEEVEAKLELLSSEADHFSEAKKESEDIIAPSSASIANVADGEAAAEDESKIQAVATENNSAASANVDAISSELPESSPTEGLAQQLMKTLYHPNIREQGFVEVRLESEKPLEPSSVLPKDASLNKSNIIGSNPLAATLTPSTVSVPLPRAEGIPFVLPVLAPVDTLSGMPSVFLPGTGFSDEPRSYLTWIPILDPLQVVRTNEVAIMQATDTLQQHSQETSTTQEVQSPLTSPDFPWAYLRQLPWPLGRNQPFNPMAGVSALLSPETPRSKDPVPSQISSSQFSQPSIRPTRIRLYHPGSFVPFQSLIPLIRSHLTPWLPSNSPPQKKASSPASLQGKPQYSSAEHSGSGSNDALVEVGKNNGPGEDQDEVPVFDEAGLDFGELTRRRLQTESEAPKRGMIGGGWMQMLLGNPRGREYDPHLRGFGMATPEPAFLEVVPSEPGGREPRVSRDNPNGIKFPSPEQLAPALTSANVATSFDEPLHEPKKELNVEDTMEDHALEDAMEGQGHRTIADSEIRLIELSNEVQNLRRDQEQLMRALEDLVTTLITQPPTTRIQPTEPPKIERVDDIAEKENLFTGAGMASAPAAYTTDYYEDYMRMLEDYGYDISDFL